MCLSRLSVYTQALSHEMGIFINQLTEHLTMVEGLHKVRVDILWLLSDSVI